MAKVQKSPHKSFDLWGSIVCNNKGVMQLRQYGGQLFAVASGPNPRNFPPPLVVEFTMLSMQYSLYPESNRFREEQSLLRKIDATLYGIFDRYQNDVRKIKMRKADDLKLQKLYCRLRDELVNWCEKNVKMK